MARIGIFSGEKKRWVQFDTDTEVLIRHVGKKELSEITHKTQKTARLSGADSRDVFNLRFGRAAVHGWRKIGQPDHPGLMLGDQPLPFNEQNLNMLMEHSLEFSAFVNETAVDSHQFLEEEEAKGEVKNG